MGGLVPTYQGYNPRRFAMGEWKYKDIDANVDFNTTATMTLLNGLAPGTSASQRVGMKIAVRSIELHMHATSTTGTGDEQVARLSIVLDRQPNGAAPSAITDIITASSVSAMRNLANRKRFKLLWDKRYPFGSTITNASTGTPTTRVMKLYMKFRRPIIVDYNSGVAGTVADISTNSLYLLTLGTVAPGNGDVTATFYARIRYTDM